jgi:hypothetical protein
MNSTVTDLMQLRGRRCSKGECFNATMRCYCIIRITRHTNATDNIGIHQYWFIYIPYKICGVNHCAIHVLIIIDRMPLPAINSQVRCTVMQNRSCSARDGLRVLLAHVPPVRAHGRTHWRTCWSSCIVKCSPHSGLKSLCADALQSEFGRSKVLY